MNYLDNKFDANVLLTCIEMSKCKRGLTTITTANHKDYIPFYANVMLQVTETLYGARGQSDKHCTQQMATGNIGRNRGSTSPCHIKLP